MGQEMTWQRARQSVWWQGLKRDAQDYVRGCIECQLHNRPQHPKRAPLLNTDIPAHLLAKVQIHIFRPIADVYKTKIYLLAMQDGFTRFCLLVPVRKKQQFK